MTKKEFEEAIGALERRVERLRMARDGLATVTTTKVKEHWVKGHWIREHERVVITSPRKGSKR